VGVLLAVDVDVWSGGTGSAISHCSKWQAVGTFSLDLFQQRCNINSSETHTTNWYGAMKSKNIYSQYKINQNTGI
jgi:hypothetical protein